MSIKMILHALETKVGSTASKMVLIKLCDQANDDGECWPSISSIARHCEMSRRSVINHLNKLIDDGFVERHHRADKSGRTTSNTYRILATDSEKAAPASAKSAHASAKSSPSDSAESAYTQGAEFAPSLRLTCHGNEPVRYEPANEEVSASGLPARRQSPQAGGTAVSKSGTVHQARSIGSSAWDAYSRAYLDRYGTEPVRNAKVNAQLSQLAKRLPENEIEDVIRWYVSTNAAFYVRSKHCVDLLLRDCEGLRTEWATGSRMTDTEARQLDQHDAGMEAARWVTENKELLRQMRREGKI